MAWTDFDEDTQLEQDMLRRAIPLEPMHGSGTLRATFDTATDQEVPVTVSATDTLGPSPDSCVTLLGIRPLLFGAAWKVLDLFMEEAFTQAGEQPNGRRGFKIEQKRELARRFAGAPVFLEEKIWQAVALTYDQTSELRHSLVHRTGYVDASGSLIGRDSNEGSLRPMSAVEQESFVRGILRLTEVAVQQSSDARTNADLAAHFSILRGVHGVAFSGDSPPITPIPILTVIVDRESNGSGYLLDIPHVREKSPWPNESFCDLVVEFRDLQGHDLQGRLEYAPDQCILIDPDEPPSWLT